MEPVAQEMITWRVYPQEQVAFSLSRLKPSRFDWVLVRDPERREAHPQVIGLKNPESVRFTGERWLERWARRQDMLLGPAFPIIHHRGGVPIVVVSAWGIRDPLPEHAEQLASVLRLNYRRDPIRIPVRVAATIPAKYLQDAEPGERRPADPQGGSEDPAA